MNRHQRWSAVKLFVLLHVLSSCERSCDLKASVERLVLGPTEECGQTYTVGLTRSLEVEDCLLRAFDPGYEGTKRARFDVSGDSTSTVDVIATEKEAYFFQYERGGAAPAPVVSIWHCANPSAAGDALKGRIIREIPVVCGTSEFLGNECR